jgi:hypothetical protein
MGVPTLQYLLPIALDHRDSRVRRQAAEVLRDLQVLPEFIQRMIGRYDSATVATRYRSIISLGLAGSEAALIRALNEHGSVQMAKDFLNCGLDDLEHAAREWAKRNGWAVTAFGGSSNLRWGKR